jgi:protein-disulfide isomerase
MSDDTIMLKKNALWKYLLVILAAFVIVFAFVYFSNKGSTTGDVITGEDGRVEIPITEQDAQIGNPDAKVTIVEFTDFSCPFCAAASGDNEEMVAYMKQRSSSWEPIVTNVMKDYVETGEVRFVSKYSAGHSGGHPAQLVAWCLNEQGLYWEFYQLAYANQADVEDLDKMKELASGIDGVDMAKLEECLSSGKYDSRFEQEQNQASAAGVQGTPAFFVNGRLVEGAVPYSQVKQMIEEELKA